MAKEGKNVRKGFGFYLIIILLALFLAFVAIVCALVMMPKTKILGLQYYSYNDPEIVIKEVPTGRIDEKGKEITEAIDFSKIVIVEINVGSSNVSINAINSLTNEEESAIKIKNNSSGFAKATDNVELSYTIDYDSLKYNILKIDVTEPTGFLNFSNDISVEFAIAQPTGPIDSIPSVWVTTTSGNITIGQDVKTGEKPKPLYIGSLSAKTKSGTVALKKTCFLSSTAEMGYLDVETESGNFTNESSQPYLANAKLKTKTGNFSLGSIFLPSGSVKANLGNGKLTFDELTNLDVQGDNFTVSGKKIDEDLFGSGDLKKGTFNITEVGMDISFPRANEVNFNIKKVGGQVYIQGTKGNINIGGEYKYKDEEGNEVVGFTREQSGLGDVCYISTQSGKINVVVNDKANVTRYFESTNGEIDIEFATTIKSKNHITSQTGKVKTLNRDGDKRTYIFKNKNCDLYEKLNSKLDIALIINGTYSNPLKLFGSTGDDVVIDIATDGVISCGLLKLQNN